VFTGIVEEIGTVATVRPLEGGRHFGIAAATTLHGLRLGDSVSIDGACHTVVEIEPDGFAVQSVATTLERTTMGDLQVGSRVNLERALALGDRLGGHMVQGHVDGVARVLSVEPRGEHVLIDFTVPPEVESVTVLHGSISLHGVSLTVNAVPEPGRVQVSIIPHTWQVTTLSDLAVGSRANVEGDMIGKYVRHLLGRPGRNVDAPEHLLRAWGY
jgi:riboflavin synthase